MKNLLESEDGFGIMVALFLVYHIYHFTEYVDCGLSARAWWNNHRMQRIISASAWLLAFLTVLLKTLGLSETVFDVTRKEKRASTEGDGDAPTGHGEADPGRFTFDASPVFVPVTALAILNVAAVAVGVSRAVFGTETDGVRGGGGGPGVGEFVCCGWLALCFWPFVRGLVGKGSYGIPWSVQLKAGLLVAAFMHFCRKN